MIIKTINHTRLIIRGPGYPRLPFNNRRPWVTNFIGIGSNPDGSKIIGIIFRLKDGQLWAYDYGNLTPAVANNWKALLTTTVPSLQQQFVKGVFFNLSLPPIAFNKFKAD